MFKVRKMMHKIRRLFKEERGNMMVLFAGSLIVMIAFIGLSLDVGLLSLQRNSLQNLNQVIREDRFTYQDKIRYAPDPTKAICDITHNTLAKNGFKGTVKIYFYEVEPTPNRREYRIRTVLSEEFSWCFATVLGMTTTTVSATQDGREIYGEDGIGMVYHPVKSRLLYNGSYTSTGSPVFSYDSYIPADMKT